MAPAVGNDCDSGKRERLRDASDNLRRAFDALRGRAYAASPRERDALREAVCAFVQERKRAAVSIEATIIELRRIADRAGISGFAERTLEDAVRWCIGEYYRDDAPH